MTLRLTDRLLLPLRLARARGRGLFRPERELGPPLAVEAFDPGFPEGEAAYNAIGRDGQGVVWFAIGTKQIDVGARLFRFESEVRAVADLDEVLETPGALPHGKVHVDFVSAGDVMIGATHVGYYDLRRGMERPASQPYPGGWFFAIERGRVVPLAQAPAGEGIITMSADLGRGTLFALTWPGGLLLTLDLASRTLRNHGPVHGAGERGSKADGTWSRICRSIGVDPRTGAAFWSNDRGQILRFDGSVATVASTPRAEMWRKVLWHDGRFHGVLRHSSMLFRFDPRSGLCEELGPLRATEAPATLALGLEGNTIHALVTGPGVLRERQPQIATTVMHMTHDLGTGTTRASGPLRLADGRWVTQSQSLLLSDGHAYSLCWVEVPSRDRSPRAEAIRRLRRATPEYRSRGYAEEMMLIRFALRR